jgi:hypothetical protein
MATYMDGMDGGKHNSDNTESTPKKKIYTVQQSAPAMQYWYYHVEAESEEEAISIVENGDAEVYDYEIDSAYGEDEYEIMDWREAE